MSKISIVFFLFVASAFQTLFAHNSLISLIKISQKDAVWLLNMSAASTAFDYALLAKYPEVNFSQMPSQELMKLLTQYLKETIHIQANMHIPILLENGVVRPGHQTDIVFELKGMPNDLKSLSVQVNSFSGNSQHVGLLLIVAKVGSGKFFLKEKNKYTVLLKPNAKGDFQEILPRSLGNLSYFSLIGALGLAGVVLLSLGMVLARNRQRQFMGHFTDFRYRQTID